MTPQEWLSSGSPDQMLRSLGGRASGRKLRLFACAAYRRVLGIYSDRQDRRIVKLAELLADGVIGDNKLARAMPYAGWGRGPDGVTVFQQWNGWRPAADLAREAVAAICSAVSPSPALALADLLRDIVGPVGDQVPHALSGTERGSPEVLRIAKYAYSNREGPAGVLDQHALLVLADALEEAGCSDEVILGHLRGPGPHARGCWALDLVLGKE